MHGRMFGSLSGLYSLDSSSTHPQLRQPKISLGIVRRPLGGKVAPSWRTTAKLLKTHQWLLCWIALLFLILHPCP